MDKLYLTKAVNYTELHLQNMSAQYIQAYLWAAFGKHIGINYCEMIGDAYGS